MLPGLESLNNGPKLTVVRFVPGFRWNHLAREEGHRMLSAQIVRGQLTEDSTNSIAGCIRLNPDMTFRVKVVEDRSFDERLSQFGKGLPSSGCEKARLRFFGLGRFLNFRPNLIVINLIVINLSSTIQLASATSSSTTTNPDSAFTGSCFRLSTP